MDNSSSIAFALIAGFVVFITVKGELPAYLCVVGIGNNCATPPPDPTTQTNPAPTQAPSTGAGAPSQPAPPNNGGNSGGNIPVFSGIGNPGWGPVFPPTPTFPQPPQQGGTGVSTTFYCLDANGDLINCDAESNLPVCYDETGLPVSCD